MDSIIEAYLRHAQEHYAGGREAANQRAILHRLARSCGDLPAGELRALRLRAWRDELIDAGLARPYINRCVKVVRLCWRWAVSMELVEPDALHSLEAVDQLRRGRTRATEPAPVRPVPPEHILACLPHLTPPIRGIVELLRLTGARTGEIRVMRTRDIDQGRDDGVWVYRPTEHKCAHRGHDRVIPLDELCQRIILERLRPFAPDAFVFESPRGGPYAEGSIRNAVSAACDRAGVPRWHPHQIRHAVLTEIRQRMPDQPDAWRALAGHASIRTTEIYAEADQAAAIAAQRALRASR